MTKYDVHCCCNPKLLLGHIEVAGALKPGPVCFRLLDDTHLSLELALWQQAMHGDGPEPGVVRKLALKSNDMPLERLRLIPGFVEADNTIVKFTELPDDVRLALCFRPAFTVVNGVEYSIYRDSTDNEPAMYKVRSCGHRQTGV